MLACGTVHRNGVCTRMKTSRTGNATLAAGLACAVRREKNKENVSAIPKPACSRTVMETVRASQRRKAKQTTVVPMHVYGELPSVDGQPCRVYVVFARVKTRTKHSGRLVFMNTQHALGLHCGDQTMQETVLAAIERDRVVHRDNAECVREVHVHFVPWSLVQILITTPPLKAFVFEADEYTHDGVKETMYEQVTRVCRAHGWPKTVQGWLLDVAGRV